MNRALPGEASNRCTHPSLAKRGTISLPVLADHNPQGRIRKSKNGKRRAAVLVAVQSLIILHIVVWVLSGKYGWFGGKTITPIEPSESVEFAKYGIVNVGLIFFALALLSTLIFGRWFCGWGCHIVMLQDFCAWIMKKCGVRPRAFRSRFLVYAPLLLALYMFIMPGAYRWGLVPLDTWLSNELGPEHRLVRFIEDTSTILDFPLPFRNVGQWTVNAHLTTTEFWKTFPGVMIAVPFLLICGFATVYFLGSKGFCTYGCPYGGFFAPLDKLAPGRILVTDACAGCGHCTAVCTSNVRVHEEVREYGMVVDPGCMKCLDCVSVCPNEALYFGFARPAVLKGAPKNRAPKRHYDLTLAEEIVLSLVFLLVFLAVRGVYGVVPLLMASGLAGLVAFITWKLGRMLRDSNVPLYRVQLKLRGKITPGGWMYAGFVLLTLGLTVHSGIVRAAYVAADFYDRKVTVPAIGVFGTERADIPPQMAAAAKRGLRLYDVASSIGDGGIGLLGIWQPRIDARRAWLYSVGFEFDQADRILRADLDKRGRSESIIGLLCLVLRAQGRNDEAAEMYTQTLAEEPGYTRMMDDFVSWASSEGRIDQAVGVCRQRLKTAPNDLQTMRWLSIVLLQTDTPETWQESVDLTRRTIEMDPSNSREYFYLAMGLTKLGREDEAIETMHNAIRLAPDDLNINVMMANLLEHSDRKAESQPYRQKAMEIQQKMRAHLHQQ